jgi:hypothetical protein
MAKIGPASITIEYDNSGGTLVDISQHVLTINDVDVESLTEEVHTFGDSWEESLGIGVGRMAPVEISGLFDDTASTGPDALFKRSSPEGPASTSRTLKITWGTNTTSVETWVASYRRTADRGALTRYTARLQPTGTVTEA